MGDAGVGAKITLKWALEGQQQNGSYLVSNATEPEGFNAESQLAGYDCT
jgi:hypothetical protein